MSLLGTSTGLGLPSTTGTGLIGTLLGGGSTGSSTTGGSSAGAGSNVVGSVDAVGGLVGSVVGDVVGGAGTGGSTSDVLSPILGPVGAIDVGHLLEGLNVLDLPVLLDAHLLNQDLADTALHLHGGNLYAGPGVEIGGILGTAQGEIVQLSADTVLGSVAFGSGNDQLISPDLALTTGVIDGGDGNDQLGIGVGDATLEGGAGDDRLVALGDGNNRFDGGSGADYMAAGGGDDVYVVDNAGDVVVEAPAEGDDTVESSISYTLAAEVERLILTGHAATNGTGNLLANHLTGNDAVNVLDGGQGADYLAGGNGDDTYVVDNAGDLVVEAANSGTDLVKATVDFTLGDNVENLQFAGDANLNGTGNNLANQITGNNGNNTLWGGLGNDTLDGRAGSDTMLGGMGDDSYTVNTTADKILENANEGLDRVISTVSYTLSANLEQLTLLTDKAINAGGNDIANTLNGNDAANKLMGMAGNDVLFGNGGADVLIGGAGKDVMTGGAGSDIFTFQSAADFGGRATTTGDVITDFHRADGDKIDLSMIDADTTKAGMQHFSFGAGSGLGHLNIAYINGDTFLSADTDGDKASDFVIRLTGHLDLTTADLII